MAKEFDTNSPENCRISIKHLRKKLQISRRKLTEILKFFDEKRRIYSVFDDTHIELNCPKLKELSDTYTSKMFKQCPNKVPAIEEDIEVEEERDNPCIMSMGFNNSIIHKSENSSKIKLKEYKDFCKNDITSIFCEICGEKTGAGVGFLSKRLKELSIKVGDAQACAMFRNILFTFWSELKSGEEPTSRTAALIARIKKET